MSFTRNDDWESHRRLIMFTAINAHYYIPAIKIGIILQLYIGYFFINFLQGVTFVLIWMTLYLSFLIIIHLYLIYQYYEMNEDLRESEKSPSANRTYVSSKIFNRITNPLSMAKNYSVYLLFFLILNPPLINKKMDLYVINWIWSIIMTILMILPEIALYVSSPKKREPSVLLPLQS